MIRYLFVLCCTGTMIDIGMALLRKTPSEHLPLITSRNMYEFTVNRGLRPPIPPNCPSDMKLLIERSWYTMYTIILHFLLDVGVMCMIGIRTQNLGHHLSKLRAH
jgi:hypothetical protein